jgi:hypothetical protein
MERVLADCQKVLSLGDLFYDTVNIRCSEATMNGIISARGRLKRPLGKYPPFLSHVAHDVK